LISLNPEKSNIGLISEEEEEPSKAFIIPEKWMMRQHENGDTFITNLSDSVLQIEDEISLKKDESEQIFGGERISFEDSENFEYCVNLVQRKKNQLKREREESSSSSVSSQFKEKEEVNKVLKSCENILKIFACVVCAKIDEKCVVVQPCLHNFCPSCLLDVLKKSPTCPAVECGRTLKSVSKNKVIQDGFGYFKDGLGDLKKSTKESSIKLQKDLEGDIIIDKKGVFIGPRSVSQKTQAYGIKLFTSGFLYQGNWSSGSMNGEGMLTITNGWSFKGNWKSDGLSDAEVSFKGETFYRGEIQNWQLHGKGVYTYATGNVYDGLFAEGKRKGNGTMKYADGSVYQGDWKGDLKEGYGLLRSADGDVFRGIWKDDLREDGEMEYENGDFYEGEWKDDKRNGFGRLISHDETRFQGQWKDDLKDGKGMFFAKNGDQYEGIWAKDEIQGKVKISYANKDEYIGEVDVEKLQRNGKGTLVKANGDQYVGQWKDDKQHGLGKESCKDQSSFDGIWEKGRQVKGILTESNGEKYEIEKKKVDQKNRKFSSVI